jgi:predicted ribosome quality control (RQC) complex YloA/Tae2 family protein
MPLEDLYELKVDDQKIKFEGNLNSYERRNLLFQKIKKLKKGESILSERLSSLEEEMQGKQAEKHFQGLPLIRPVWGDELPVVKDELQHQKEDYKTFHYNEFKIGVGTSAQGNDQLRSRWASREDLWIHLDGLKSAHAVIKITGGTITPEILNLGASIVAHFSHFSGEWIPVIYTQVKNVKGVTGAPGMVIYKKEKHLRCPRVELADILKE